MAGQSARLNEFALVDTGSAFTIVARRLLQLNRFDLARAREFKAGLYGIGGLTKTWFVEHVTLTLVDNQSRLHHVLLPRLFFTGADMPPIFGREALRAFNALLTIDFVAENGTLRVG